MLEKIEAFAVWIQLFACCVLILALICASRLFPDGNSENAMAKMLLKNVTIQTVIEDDSWSVQYPYNETGIEHYRSFVKRVEKAVESFCTTSFPGAEVINGIVTGFKDKVMHYHVSAIPGIDDNRNYVSESIDNVLEFKEDVNAMGIPFLYVQTPSVEGIAYYNEGGLTGDSLNIAERSYCFTSALEDSGVDLINMSRDHSEGVTFDVTSHWMPTDGLKGARLISEKLKDDYGFDTDPQVFDDGNFFDLMLLYPDFKKTVEDTCGYDFVVPCPVNNPNIVFSYAEGEPYGGPYADYLFKPLSAFTPDGSYHNVYTVFNDLTYSIHNESATCDKKVLIIGDSFSWPVVTYLPLAIRDVTMVHNASFNGSLVSYIRENKPDIVIMLYNDAEFHEVYTEDAFYLK